MLLALLLGGCATGTPAVSDTPRRDFAARPSLAPVARPTSGVDASSVSRSPAATGSATPGSTPGPGSTGSSAAPPSHAEAPPYRVVGSLDDLSGDQGLEGPVYADVRRVEIADDGIRARVTVGTGGTLPVHPAAGEVLGLGVDLYARAGQLESDYQLFADGGEDGWFAYLHTPKGFVRFPGTFALGWSTVTFTVPWSTLGGRNSGQFKAFADWTRSDVGGTLGGNATSNDRAPEAGAQPYRR